MYHENQNKWFPKRVSLPISKLHSILAIPNLLAHNNVTISYYGQVNAFGGNICFGVDGTGLTTYTKPDCERGLNGLIFSVHVLKSRTLFAKKRRELCNISFSFVIFHILLLKLRPLSDGAGEPRTC